MSNVPSRRKALGQLAAISAAPMLAANPFRHVYAQTAKPIRVGAKFSNRQGSNSKTIESARQSYIMDTGILMYGWS